MPPKRRQISPAQDGSPTESSSYPELGHDELSRVFSNPATQRVARDELLQPASSAPEPELEPEAIPPRVVVTPLLVAAASTNSWKTWAGRKDGGDGFQMSDLFVGTAHAWGNYRRSWKGDRRRPGKECPVCFDDDPPPDGTGKRWMRLYCGCTVCSGCVRSWNVAEIAGDTTKKKLSCPVCLAEMRPHDAAETLQRCSSAAEALDTKARDDALRQMTNSDTGLQEWHPCPHCETGGGFVTAECISSRHRVVRRSVEEQEREELRHLVAKAELEAKIAQTELELAAMEADWTRRASNRAGDTAAIMCGAPLATCVLIATGCTRWVTAISAVVAAVLVAGHVHSSPKRQQDYAQRQRLNTTRAQHAAYAATQQQLAEGYKTEALRQRQEQLEVGCPCCDGAFNLPESSLEHAVSV